MLCRFEGRAESAGGARAGEEVETAHAQCERKWSGSGSGVD